jgi:glucokinase
MVRLTNSPWSFSTAGLKAALALDHLGIYNDFTAMVLALPWLGADDVRQVGGAASTGGETRRPLALVGPGTGLGVSALLPMGETGWLPLESEGGHVGFAPATPHEDEILHRLRQHFGRLSAERVISGMGIENVYTIASEMRDGRAAHLSAADVAARARQGDLAASETLSFFSSALGAFAGDLVLTIGAWGGLYVGGGIPMKLGALFDTTAFNRGFENKGRYAETLRRIPRWLITREHPALLGLAHDLERVLEDA